MKKIIPLNPAEEKIVSELKQLLGGEDAGDEYEALVNNESALYELAEAISKYPSILGIQHLGMTGRSVDTLVENLEIRDSADLVLHVPTKALLGKGFFFAKINFFYMLYYLMDERSFALDSRGGMMEIISGIVFNLMAEEVFLSIISDREIPEHTRSNAGYLLANIWEYRIDHGVTEFAPVLNNIWKARRNLHPSFGTMLGITELFKISGNSSHIWVDFLQRDNLCSEEVDAMREFLLGLSYEEMKILGENMERTGKSCLNENEIDIVLGIKKTYPEYIYDDPRELFKSYRHRHKNAGFRLMAGREGPKKTLEEYIMCYLLSRPGEWIAGECTH
jgi:hypothetical protein